MKNVLSTIILSAFVLSLSSAAQAQNCNSAPSTRSSAAGAQAYARWCSDCGGIPTGNFSCNPGSHWGRRDSGGNQPPDNSAAEAEAERQRQAEAERKRQDELHRQEEERLKREAEERRRKQAEFERKKREALDSMKGIAGGELGLKGADAGDLGLRGLGDTDATGLGLRDGSNLPGCKWGDQGAAVVDLRCLGLDPDRPIAVDPHVVRGEQRVFSAQVDLTLFDDPDYIKAMEAEVRPGVETMDQAIQYFRRTQLKRPNDPMVEQALLLAETLLKGRIQQRQDNKDQAVQQLCHGLAALMMGDMVTAGDLIKRAGELDPANPNVANWSLTVAAMKAHFQGTGHDVKTVEKLVGNALTSEAWGNYGAEVREMENGQESLA